jgi:hypothetical protein
MSGGGGEEAAAAAAAATSSSSSGKKRMSNIESLLVHTMPLVRCVSSRTKSGKKNTNNDDNSNEKKKKKKKDFALKELWRAFHETSAFGCEVPLEMQRRSGRRKDCEEEEENVEVSAQYYASYISAFQIFEKTTKKKGKKREEKKRDSSSSSNKASAQYFESLAPYSRPPLTDVIERLAEENEKVQSLKASEIDREKSWFCFAWYPIYRIPQGTSRTDIQGCFLTYHGLNHLDIEDEEDDEEEDGDDSDGEEEEEEEEEEEDEEEDEEATDKDEAGDKNGTTPIRGLPPPPPASLTLSGETRLQRRIEDAKKSVAVLEEDGKSTAATTATAKEGKEEGKEEEEEEHAFIPLKPFGLCCYKTDPEIWEESDEAENARTAAMIDGAYAFLRSIEVIHPDYEFFSHHG